MLNNIPGDTFFSKYGKIQTFWDMDISFYGATIEPTADSHPLTGQQELPGSLSLRLGLRRVKVQGTQIFTHREELSSEQPVKKTLLSSFYS